VNNRLQIINRPIEIFCGTGGVGKTTLAASRAIHLAKSNKKVLLITIDPSMRLKEVMGLTSEHAGVVTSVDFSNDENQASIDVLLFSPSATMAKLIPDGPSKNLVEKNRILKTLTKPFGGMSEILSILELHISMQEDQHDVYILDTPPGGHFIDFLKAGSRIDNFFAKSFVEIFKFLQLNTEADEKKKNTGILKKIIGSGIKKLLEYLRSVTGAHFVEEFIEAVHILYSNREYFLNSNQIQKILTSPETANWFLAVSVDQHKVKETLRNQKELGEFIHSDQFLLINKSNLHNLENWSPSPGNKLVTLKESMIRREQGIQEIARDNFKGIFTFSDIPCLSPKGHVTDLAGQWDKLTQNNMEP
jgi:anion-transporting  ArsA/GET3 family ATPase